MHLGELQDELRRVLAGVEDGALSVEWIVEDATGVPRLNLALCSAMPVAADEVERARAWAGRVAAGEPIQYVVGWTSFRGHRILTDRRALIPRPETEELVSRVRERLTGPARVADVGTGTGCIAIALCREEPGITVLAIDREAEALALAAENVAAQGVGDRIELRQGDLLEGIPEQSLDGVVSNPPYVAVEEMPGLPVQVRDHEPAPALESGPAGLDAIRRLVPQARRCLKPGGWLLLEIGESQAKAVGGLVEAVGFAGVKVYADLAGRDRIVAGVVGVPGS